MSRSIQKHSTQTSLHRIILPAYRTGAPLPLADAVRVEAVAAPAESDPLPRRGLSSNILQADGARVADLGHTHIQRCLRNGRVGHRNAFDKCNHTEHVWKGEYHTDRRSAGDKHGDIEIRQAYQAEDLDAKGVVHDCQDGGR
jgi:hypothetical protein